MIPLWREMVEQIDRYRLEEWEPELCITVYRALYGLTRKDRAQAELAQSTFGRLCRLDPAAALEG
jgi:hypothetical protein